MTKQEPTTQASRQRAYRKGQDSEALAARYLERQGYTIAKRRYRSPYGEIDLIAHAPGLIVFVEVKARGCADEALHALSARQRQRIIEAALHYCATEEMTGCDLRFDLMAISGAHTIHHLPHAWEAEG